MTIKDEALKLALEKFQSMNHKDSIFRGEFEAEIAEIEAALAQPDQVPAVLQEDAKKLATAIADAAKRAGILNSDAVSLSGPQLLLLLDNLVEAAGDLKGKVTYNKAPIDRIISKIELAEYQVNIGLSYLYSLHVTDASLKPSHEGYMEKEKARAISAICDSNKTLSELRSMMTTTT